MLGSAIMEAVTTQSIRRRAEQTLIFGLEQVSACLADAVYGIGQDSQTLYRGDGILGSGVVPITSPPTWEARPTILFVGAWDGRKRGAMLHHVFVDEVLPRVPDAQLWMVSDRTEQTPGVRWFEHPTDGELSDLYRRAWTFCLPSTYEGLGLPYLEALANGLDVVATPNLGALSVLHGAGRIVSDGQLGDALVASLTASAGDRRRGAESALARARDYAWPAVVAAHESAYQLAQTRFSGRRRGNPRRAARASS